MASSSITESDMIVAPIRSVWRILRDANFSFAGRVSKFVVENGEPATTVGRARTVQFDDGTATEAKLLEVSDLRYSIAWHVAKSTNPAFAVGSDGVIELKRITDGDCTFIEWRTTVPGQPTSALLGDLGASVRSAIGHLKKMKGLDCLELTTSNSNTMQLARQLSVHSQTLLDSFQEHDSNKDGRLEINEFRAIVEKMCGLGKLPDMAVNILLHEADLDGSKDIDYNEFVAFIKKREFVHTA